VRITQGFLWSGPALRTNEKSKRWRFARTIRKTAEDEDDDEDDEERALKSPSKGNGNIYRLNIESKEERYVELAENRRAPAGAGKDRGICQPLLDYGKYCKNINHGTPKQFGCEPP
jgi:hypothetical protein